jgi:hypothetical protein
MEESRMSPSSVMLKIFWDEKHWAVSLFRSCLLTCVFLLFCYLRSGRIFDIFTYLLLVWGLSFSISYLYNSKITTKSSLSKIRRERHFAKDYFNWAVRQGFRGKVYSGDLIGPEDVGGVFRGAIKILTLPFNIKNWRELIKIRYRLFVLFRDPQTWFTAILVNLLAVLHSFVLICIVFVFRIILVIFYPILHGVRLLYLIQNLQYEFVSCSCQRFCQVLVLLHAFGLVFFFCYTLYVLIHALQSLLLGLLLNLAYFTPYFAFISVLTFYCLSFWKSMEEKYFLLQRLIYECRDKYSGQQIASNEEFHVVKKNHYDKIRERLLPYDTNLSYFGLKIFWSFVFSFGVLQVINMLNEFNVTSVVQVVTTASLGIMPYIFNMVASKISEERKKASEERLKFKVKCMVKELDNELARTPMENDEMIGPRRGLNPIAAIRPPATDTPFRAGDRRANDTTADDTAANDTTADDTAADDTTTDERGLVRSGLNPPDNDDVEDTQLAPTVVGQANNDTTAEDNVQDSERVEAKFDLNPPDNDNGLPIVIIHSPSATETPIRADDETADDETAEDETADGETADDRIADDQIESDTRADENVQVRSAFNADVDDPKLAGTVTRQECNDTTDEENIQDSERVEGFELAVYDNDDISSEREALIQHETPM